MRVFTFLISLILILTSCMNSGTNKITSSLETHLSESLVNKPDKSIDTDGMISLTDGTSTFKINQENIVTGDIDGDGGIDAIVPVFYLRGNVVMEYRHYVLLLTRDKYDVVVTMNDVFKIIEIKNKRISAEVSTVAPDSPGFGCTECREVIQYLYINKALVKVE